MALNVEMDSYDYNQAIKAVQKLLNNIEVNDDTHEVMGIPTATEIVDSVWDAIK